MEKKKDWEGKKEETLLWSSIHKIEQTHNFTKDNELVICE
jgi:hypothetical protein